MLEDDVEDAPVRSYVIDVIAGMVGVFVLSVAFAFYDSCRERPPVQEPAVAAPTAAPTPAPAYEPYKY